MATCTWCFHPTHGAQCPRNIAVAAGEIGGALPRRFSPNGQPYSQIKCPCARWSA